MSLPKFVAFQTTAYNGRDRYLGNIDSTNLALNRFLSYTVDEVLSPLARFEIETVEDGLVQVRSCFTNKLWSRSSSNENWIVTASNEQEKDRSKWGCTLFKPTIKGITVTFTHVQLQRTLVLKKTGTEAVECLCVDSDVSLAEPVTATFIDLTLLVKLPKYVTFKADNKFLRRSEGDHEAVTFSQDESPKTAALFEVLQNHDGSVRLKCVKSDKIWCVSETVNSLLQDNVETLKFRFNPIMVSAGPVIALQGVFNLKYCKRLTGTDSDNLYAISPSIENSKKLQVVEPVMKRTIEVTRLRTEDFIFLSGSCYTLDTKRVEHDQMVELKSEALESMEWSKSVSLVTDLSFSIRSPTPYYDPARNCFIASEKIYKADDYKWGTKEKFTFPVRQRIPIMVPPGTNIIARLMARSTRFQIPFDYTQTDTLTFNGETQTYTNFRDGLYTGEFYSDFHIEAENEML